MDHNNANSVEENLAFLCYNHHDEYDGRTSTSKGLREGEVRKWRDELYREMEYRFKLVRKKGLSLKFVQFTLVGVDGRYTIQLKLTNVGEVEVKRPTVSIRLPAGVEGSVPRREDRRDAFRMPDLFGMTEEREDFFEPNGRVGMISPLPPANCILLTGHSTSFDALGLNLNAFPLGSELSLEYRIDAEDMSPIHGTLRQGVLATVNWSVREVYRGEAEALAHDKPLGRAVAEIYGNGKLTFEE
ncbi:MAG: hypothetical protein ACTHN5_19050 [Phycisphaerae bacterium]